MALSYINCTEFDNGQLSQSESLKPLAIFNFHNDNENYYYLEKRI